MLRFLVIIILAAAALIGPSGSVIAAIASAPARGAASIEVAGTADQMTADGGCGHCPQHRTHREPCCPRGLSGCCTACSLA